MKKRCEPKAIAVIDGKVFEALSLPALRKLTGKTVKELYTTDDGIPNFIMTD